MTKSFGSKFRSKIRKFKSNIFPDNRKNLAVVAIMKNEALNVQEWIEHYIWQGADHLYIIDNGSSDDMVEKIKNSPFSARITLINAPEKHQQVQHYRRTVRRERVKAKFKWILLVDADEFCFSKKHQKITDTLKELDWFDLIYLQWTYCGNPEQIDHPKSLRSELIYKHADLGDHRNTKYFVKTDMIKRNSISIHKFRGARSGKTITASDLFQLNHYQTQSLYFWQTVKMTRGDVCWSDWDVLRSMTDFNDYNSKCSIKETLLSDRLSAIKMQTDDLGAGNDF